MAHTKDHLQRILLKNVWARLSQPSRDGNREQHPQKVAPPHAWSAGGWGGLTRNLCELERSCPIRQQQWPYVKDCSHCTTEPGRENGRRQEWEEIHFQKCSLFSPADLLPMPLIGQTSWKPEGR